MIPNPDSLIEDKLDLRLQANLRCILPLDIPNLSPDPSSCCHITGRTYSTHYFFEGQFLHPTIIFMHQISSNQFGTSNSPKVHFDSLWSFNSVFNVSLTLLSSLYLVHAILFNTWMLSLLRIVSQTWMHISKNPWPNKA